MRGIRGEPVEVWLRDGRPARFVWRGRMYTVMFVLDRHCCDAGACRLPTDLAPTDLAPTDAAPTDAVPTKRRTPKRWTDRRTAGVLAGRGDAGADVAAGDLRALSRPGRRPLVAIAQLIEHSVSRHGHRSR